MSDEPTELYRRLRPRKLDDVVGQDTAVRVLRGHINAKTVPHAIILHGPSGTGKTTIARILARSVGCSRDDFIQLNSADNRGINNIREIRDQMSWGTLGGGSARVWLFDECFAVGTLVDTPTGKRPIESIKKGDVVFSMSGATKVKHVFANQVTLSRIVRVDFSNGSHVHCSEDHLFFTDRGWTEAKNLDQSHCIFSRSGYPMSNQIGGGCDDKEMPNLFGGFSHHGRSPDLLFQKLRAATQTKESRSRKDNNETLPRMQKTFHISHFLPTRLLRAFLPGPKQDETAGIPSSTLQCSYEEENLRIAQTIPTNGGGGGCPWGQQETHVPRESNARPVGGRENDGDEKKERHVSQRLGRSSRREWEGSTRAATAFEPFGEQMGSRVPNTNAQETRIGLSQLLQSGFSTPGAQTSDGGRRDWALVERAYLSRRQKDRASRIVGVDRVTSYKPGRNDEDFAGVIKDKESRQGFATLYDLEVDGHPSYFVNNGVPVHNCHQMTGEAQQAALLMTEEPPSHVYFIFATTHLPKIIPTLRGRCEMFELKSIAPKIMEKLVADVAAKEKIKVSKDVLEGIVRVAGGSAREALVLLGKVQRIDDEDERLSVLVPPTTEKAAYDLVKVLMPWKGKPKWIEVADVLRSVLEEERAEGLRQLIVAVAKKSLLDPKRIANHAQASLIIQTLRDPFFDAENAASAIFASCCYEICVLSK